MGPHLQLIRNVCEPLSTSMPHVTVRYFQKLNSVREKYRNTHISHIDLIEPGSFGLDDKSLNKHHTVYIRCKSADLEPLEHKPLYPYSELHITLYDGMSVDFATKLLKIVKNYKWHLRVQLPENATLHEIQIKTGKSKPVQSFREYSNNLKTLFYSVTSEQLNLPNLINLSDDRRLQITTALCENLYKATANFVRVKKSYKRKSKKIITLDHGIDITNKLHLTPPELALDIAEYALNMLGHEAHDIHFGDPAVGTGVFYQALRQVVAPEHIASAMGIDIGAKQVSAAQSKWSQLQMQIIHGDYLHMERLSPRTLILANPPYLRHQSISKEYKNGLRERASVNMNMQVSARSGMYVYFILLSHGWMASGAIAAWLIPSEFMQTNYGIALRQYLTQSVQLIRIHQFAPNDPQFEHVMTLPAVVVFRNTPPSDDQTVILSIGGTLHNPTGLQTVRIDELRKETKWVIPRSTSNNTNFSKGFRIGDLFIVRRGIATGANDFFIIDRAKAMQMGIPEVALRPILPKMRTLETDIIEAEEDGYPKVASQLCLIDCSLSEDEIKDHYPRFMKYLMTARELGIRDLYIVRNRQIWYRQEHREPATFLCTYMGRGGLNTPPLRFIWNKSRAVAANTYLMLYPRPALSELISERPEITALIFALLKETARETMSENMRMYAGGLRKIEPKELLQVRLSSTPEWLVQAVDQSELFKY